MEKKANVPLLCQPRLHNHAENRIGRHALLRHGKPDTPAHKNRGWGGGGGPPPPPPPPPTPPPARPAPRGAVVGRPRRRSGGAG
ncbi:MAG: hypothetical protein ABF719_11940, partial [Acetobacter sp.]